MNAHRYQRVIAVAAVLVFFTNLSVYVSIAEIVPISPWHIILVFGVAAAPFLLSDECLARMRGTPVAYWCFGFVLISGVWLLFQGLPSTAAWQEFRTRILSVFLLLLLVCILSDDQAQAWARRAVLVSVLMAVALNVYELFNPLAFSPALGRSAGFYVNPNQSGAGLILGMIFSVGLLPRRFRLLFAFTVGLGVFLTFSRAAIAGWFIAVFAIIATGVINLRRSLVMASFVLTVTAFVMISQWEDLRYRLEDSGVLNKDVSRRIEGFTDIGQPYSDESAAVRGEVAAGAWEMFADKPVLGHGVGASKEWRFEVATHNEYLSLMVDHGFIGLFLLPLLALAALWRARGDTRKIGIAFAVFILFWGLFSHSILEEGDVLIMFSLLSAMAGSSRRDPQPDRRAFAHLRFSHATSRG